MPPEAPHDATRATRLLPDALLVGLATAVAYLLAFYFEKGYFDAFLIPSDLIEIRLDTVLLFAAVTMAALVIIFPLVNFTVLIVSSVTSETVSRAMAPLLLVLVPLLVEMYSFGLSHVDHWLPWLVVFLVLVFLQLIFPLITQRRTKGYANKLAAQEATEAQFKSIPDVVRAKFGRPAVLFIALLLVGMSLAWQLGQAQALGKSSFLALEDDPTLLVVRSYPSRIILAKLDEAAGTLNSEYVILPLPPEGLSLITRNLPGVRFPLRATATPPPTPSPPTPSPSPGDAGASWLRPAQQLAEADPAGWSFKGA